MRRILKTQNPNIQNDKKRVKVKNKSELNIENKKTKTSEKIIVS
jgi:hypothetical protein